MKNKIMEAVKKAAVEKNMDISMEIVEVKKVNQNLTGLSMMPVGGSVGCTVYLENYIPLAKDTTLEDVAEDILKQYATYMADQDLDGNVINYYSKEYIKNNVSVQLINAEVNADYLQGAAHTKFLDLAGIYRVKIPVKGKFASYVLTYEHLNSLGIEVQELYEWATRNDAETANFSGASLIQTMLDMVPEFEDLEPSMMDRSPNMWVFTNEAKLFGASVLLHPETFSPLAEKWNGDLLIFPSSVHEVIAVKYDAERLEEYQCMVSEINSSDDIEIEDFLSNSVYVYKKSSGTIDIAGKEPEDEI